MHGQPSQEPIHGTLKYKITKRERERETEREREKEREREHQIGSIFSFRTWFAWRILVWSSPRTMQERVITSMLTGWRYCNGQTTLQSDYCSFAVTVIAHWTFVDHTFRDRWSTISYSTNFQLDKHDRVYIATQGPMEDTIADFWRMWGREVERQRERKGEREGKRRFQHVWFRCWEFDVYCIVMLCRTVEDGKNRCCQYWPEKVGEFKTYGKIFVNNKKVSLCGRERKREQKRESKRERERDFTSRSYHGNLSKEAQNGGSTDRSPSVRPVSVLQKTETKQNQRNKTNLIGNW